MAPRIAICGVHIEASTFSPHHSSEVDFTQLSGQALVDRYPFLASGSALRTEVEWVPVFHAGALPGGAVEADTYVGFRQRIVTGLREALAEAPLDGILFDIHGAMSVLGMDDAEGDLVTAIRQVVGPDVVISAAMDLHGNVSSVLFEGCDLLTCYRTAPHVDVWETRERAVTNLLAVLAVGRKPAKALVHVPVLLPGEMTSTRLEPAASLYARVPEVEAADGIIDAAIWIGFAWADEPRNQAAIVVTGWDEAAVEREALGLGREFWAARHEFCFVAPTDTFAGALATAVASDARPFFISDSGDNPGAGGADDCTHALAELLACEPVTSGRVSAVVASIVDPAAVELAQQVGVGGEADFEVGGHMDTRDPGTQRLRATVANLGTDARGGALARLVVGGLSVIVTAVRDQYCELEQYRRAGIEPAETDIVVVKMGYLEPELFETQRGWVLALTPGGVDQDLPRLGHSRIARPMIPFDDEVPRPEVLTARG